mmetsp:Transcript_14086/g.28224  ORF Transcript_14086/g.28224 Transcript_14086/m.28224 type:complete len:100 (+) Transcript_14086:1536-1835(+)
MNGEESGKMTSERKEGRKQLCGKGSQEKTIFTDMLAQKRKREREGGGKRSSKKHLIPSLSPLLSSCRIDVHPQRKKEKGSRGLSVQADSLSFFSFKRLS